MRKLLFRIVYALYAWICPGVIYAFPPGITPDNSAMFGLFQAMWLLNIYAYSYVAVTSTSTTQTLLAALLVQSGIINYTGTTGGTMTLTTDTATNIIAAMQNGSAGPALNGTYSEPLRIVNSTGSAITVAAGTGVTLGTGTNSITSGSWREYMVIPTAAGAVTLQTIGGGTI